MKRLDDTFLTWLPRIRENPGVFLGEPSLTALSHFWNGYAFREMPEKQEKQTYANDLKECEKTVVPERLSKRSEKHFMDGFEKFAYSYFGCDWSTQGWVKLITEHCNSEAEAFNKFFELFDMFIKEKE